MESRRHLADSHHRDHRGHREQELRQINTVTEAVIGSAINVHRALGPGLLESAYERCLAIDLILKGLRVERQVPLPLTYRGVAIDLAYRLDLRVADRVIVEVKSVDKLVAIHQAQVLSYLKLSKIRVGLLINFNVRRLVDGVTRLILD
jgi:GxxExxY protein